MGKLIKKGIKAKKKEELAASLSDLDPMPFGQHKGVPMQDVPCDYLHYLWENGLSKDTVSKVANYIRTNIDVLKMEDDDLIWTMGK